MASRNITLRGWLSKSMGKVSAQGFIEGSKEFFLKDDELADQVIPIIEKFEAKDILPSVALLCLQKAVIAHQRILEERKADEAVNKAMSSSQTKKYKVSICDPEGNVIIVPEHVNETGKVIPEKEMISQFEMMQQAEQWAALRLYDTYEGCYAKIDCLALFTKEGHPMEFKLSRLRALGIIKKQKKTPFMKDNSRKQAPLGWNAKCKQKTQHFSRG
jgi:hypothetical protein